MYWEHRGPPRFERRRRTRYGDGAMDHPFADACMLLHEALALQRRCCLPKVQCDTVIGRAPDAPDGWLHAGDGNKISR